MPGLEYSDLMQNIMNALVCLVIISTSHLHFNRLEDSFVQSDLPARLKTIKQSILEQQFI